MVSKRARKSDAPSKSSMEESADALAGVEGALATATDDKPAAEKSSPKKKAKVETTAAVPDPMAATTTAGGKKKKAAAAKATAKEPAKKDKEPAADAVAIAEAVTAAASSSKADKKAQISYTPDVNMTKEQLTAWRREMRRVRNRESAAASRRKVRDRIEELEEEVNVWKKRYAEVMAKLGDGEEVAKV